MKGPSLKDFDKRSALADKYGWRIGGWAVDLDNKAGISLWDKWTWEKHLRFQHSDSLQTWEKVLRANVKTKPKVLKKKAKVLKKKAVAKTFDDVVAENTLLKAKLKSLTKSRKRSKP